MSHLVIARKYRPKSFQNVVFQDHVVQTLQSSIRQDRVAHAYIFNGPRGVGKTSLARIFARAMNCEQGPIPEPCGVCSNCIEITAGNSMDVMEIDGASNNSVENIRNLRESARFTPLKGKYKIYIIDEVHMLTQAAFNALLKILEEPPAHIIFIFATTEVHKIPSTILSRCQRFTFKRIPYTAIMENLKQVLDAEKIEAQDMALYWIAKQSGGSMRDAQSLLEQVIAYSVEKDKKRIQEKDVKDLLGIASFELYKELLTVMKNEHPGTLVEVLRQGFDSGVDGSRFVEGILEFLRALLLVNQKVTEPRILDLPAEEVKNLTELAQQYPDYTIHYIFDQFRQLQQELKFVTDEYILLEMILLRIYNEIRRPDLAQLLTRAADILTGNQTEGALESHSFQDSSDLHDPLNSSVSKKEPIKDPIKDIKNETIKEPAKAPTKESMSETVRNAPANIPHISSQDTDAIPRPMDENTSSILNHLKEKFEGREITKEERKQSKDILRAHRSQYIKGLDEDEEDDN